MKAGATGRAKQRAPAAERFQRAVYRLVEEIPRGRVATYGQLAAILGWPRACRGSGWSLRAGESACAPMSAA